MSFRIGLLENSCLFEEQMDPPGKFMSVRGTDGPSWKIHVCSRNKWTLLENYKKVAPGKKEQIFSKTVSVAASGVHTMPRIMDLFVTKLWLNNYVTYERSYNGVSL